LIRIDKSLIDNVSIDESCIVIKHQASAVEQNELDGALSEGDASDETVQQTARDVLAAAYKESKELVEGAKQEADAIRQDAWQQGYAHGRDEAERQAGAQLRAKSAQAVEFLEQLKSFKENLIEGTEEKVLELSLVIAEKIVNHELKKDDSIYKGIVKQAVKKLGTTQKLRIFIGQSDHDKYFKDSLSWLEFEDQDTVVEVIIDPNMKNGDCVFESDQAFVNAGISLQLDKIKGFLSEGIKCG